MAIGQYTERTPTETHRSNRHIETHKLKQTEHRPNPANVARPLFGAERERSNETIKVIGGAYLNGKRISFGLIAAHWDSMWVPPNSARQTCTLCVELARLSSSRSETERSLNPLGRVTELFRFFDDALAKLVTSSVRPLRSRVDTFASRQLGGGPFTGFRIFLFLLFWCDLRKLPLFTVLLKSFTCFEWSLCSIILHHMITLMWFTHWMIPLNSKVCTSQTFWLSSQEWFKFGS